MAKSYTHLTWRNDKNPFIDEDNLNHIEKGITDAIDQANTNETSIDGIKTEITRIEQIGEGIDANAKKAEESATKAESYAVGGTGTRTGEDTDNAKYYSGQAKASATSASASATNASTAEKNAQTYATNANTSATNASTSESNAKKCADSIKDSADKINELDTRVKVLEEEEEVEDISDSFLKKYFAMQRTGKLYGVKQWKFASNQTSAMVKTRDNANLVCVPSTEEFEGQDDYADIPLFKWYEVNYKRYDDGFAYPTAMKGHGDYAESGSVDCGSMMMTFYYKQIESDDSYELIISDSPNDALGLVPWEDAVRADGTVMPYFITSRYVSGEADDGLLRSQPYLKYAWEQSHNNMITNYQKKGSGYWGAGASRWTLVRIFQDIKYANKSSQATFAGCTSYSFQYTPAVKSSDKHTYFPLTQAQANNVVVGSALSVGYPNGTSTDRGNDSMSAYAKCATVLKVEVLDDGNYGVYLDCDAFSTADTSDGKAIYLSSMPWSSGSTNGVIGHHDGSKGSNTNGKYPFRVQGIEVQIGAYEAASDQVFVFGDSGIKNIYKAKRGVSHSSAGATILANYTNVEQIEFSGDAWTGDIAIHDGSAIPINKGSGASVGTGDYLYGGGTPSENTAREFLQGGLLGRGSNAGLSSLYAGHGLGVAYWGFASAD